jgi:hypothetical protein
VASRLLRTNYQAQFLTRNWNSLERLNVKHRARLLQTRACGRISFARQPAEIRGAGRFASSQLALTGGSFDGTGGENDDYFELQATGCASRQFDHKLQTPETASGAW